MTYCMIHAYDSKACDCAITLHSDVELQPQVQSHIARQ